MRKIFRFLRDAYRTSGLRATPLATDRTRFYTMITSLINSDLLDRYTRDNLVAKLDAFGQILLGKRAKPSEGPGKAVQRYQVLSSDRTTDTPRREERQEKFIEVLDALAL